MSRAETVRPETGAKAASPARPTVAILDFGSQYTQLIARRVRESRVYCEIFPHDITPAELRAKNVIGVILSGGPASVYDEGAPSVDPRVINGDFPVLGICYGMQLMAHLLGGTWSPRENASTDPPQSKSQTAPASSRDSLRRSAPGSATATPSADHRTDFQSSRARPACLSPLLPTVRPAMRCSSIRRSPTRRTARSSFATSST